VQHELGAGYATYMRSQCRAIEDSLVREGVGAVSKSAPPFLEYNLASKLAGMSSACTIMLLLIVSEKCT
jgi:hypothetical protein